MNNRTPMIKYFKRGVPILLVLVGIAAFIDLRLAVNGLITGVCTYLGLLIGYVGRDIEVYEGSTTALLDKQLRESEKYNRFFSKKQDA